MKPGPPPLSDLPERQTDDPRIRTLLEEGPLYRSTEYKTTGRSRLPGEIEMPCGSPRCGKQQVHDLQKDSSHEHALYLCRNCRVGTHRFLLEWDRHHEDHLHTDPLMGDTITRSEVGKVTKTGQFPPIADRLLSALEKRLGETRSNYYRTARRLRNLNLGIGAVAYLRRVVEEMANDLLDIVVEEAELAGSIKIDLTELKRVREGRVFEQKMEFAKAALPTRLTPGGHNPIEKLHALASAGLHGESEEECVRIFDSAWPVFEFFFAELPERLTREKEFRKQVSEL